MELLGNLGIEPVLLLAQIVNFLIIAWVIRRFVYGPVKKMMDERRSRIDQGLADAHAARAALDDSRRERDALLADTRKQIQELLEQSRQAATAASERASAQSRAESERIVNAARGQAEQEFKSAQQRFKWMVREASRAVLSGVIPSLFTGDEKDRVLAQAAEKIRSGADTNGPGSA